MRKFKFGQRVMFEGKEGTVIEKMINSKEKKNRSVASDLFLSNQFIPGKELNSEDFEKKKSRIKSAHFWFEQYAVESSKDDLTCCTTYRFDDESALKICGNIIEICEN